MVVWLAFVVVVMVVWLAFVVRVVVVKAVVEIVVVDRRLIQNNDSKRKTLPQRSQPGYTNNSL